MKILNKVATVVAVVASVVGMVFPPAMAVAAVASLVAVGTSMAISKPKATVGGSQTDVRLDPQAPVPYIVGRTYSAGTLALQDTFGANNLFLGSVLIYSGGGPIEEFEAFQADRTTIAFTAGAATGTYAGYMWLVSQLGATPESAALVSSQGTLPGWDSASKLSGYCAALLTVKFDTAGKKFTGGFPQIGGIFKGAKVYDPAQDSTYPGGSGAHRSNDETTWTYSQNPWLHALTWAIGRHQNGERVLGVGWPIDSIVVARFVEAANVADANGWTCGGVPTSDDEKWNVLKLFAQAGGGEPIRLGGELGCDFQTSRVSLATVTSADLVGPSEVMATQGRRDRFNTAIPRCRLETHGWETVALEQISVASYVTEDGDTRTREIDLPLVQDKDQAAQLATYEIVNSREFGPIKLTLKPSWIGYRPGDCLTLTISELGLSAQKAVITRRMLDPESGQVSLELKSETDSKHAFALGKSGTAPTTPTVTPSGTALETVTNAHPAVSRIDTDNGQALATFIDINGRTLAKIAETGEARDGDVITFSPTLPAVPKIVFQPGGNAAVAGENVIIQAEGLTVSGFTMKAVSQGVTAGSTITDGSSAAGGGGEPDRVINRTDAGAPFDGRFTFRFPVTVGTIAPGEPGYVEIGIFVKRSGIWGQVATEYYTASGTYNVTVTPGSVDFGAGNEFGVDLVSSEASGSALTGFTHVQYVLGTVAETSLTPAGASAIAWQALLP